MAVHPTASILIPCRNEEEALPALVARLRTVLPDLARIGWDVSVILFDDGSRDHTYRIMNEQVDGDDRFLVVRNDQGLGIGGVLRRAVTLTDSEVIVTLDADGTYDPADVHRLLDAIDAGADIVTGSPYHPQGHVDNVPEWRLALSMSLSRLYRATTPMQLWTYTSLFRAYRREVLESVEWSSNGFLAMAEVLVEASATGFRIVEVPATLSRRRFGVSKLRTAQVVRDHLRYLARISLQPTIRRRLRTRTERPPALTP